MVTIPPQTVFTFKTTYMIHIQNSDCLIVDLI